MTNPMCVTGTPVEHYPDLGLFVKREDLSCPGGPNFSKTRGVYAHVLSRPEPIIGVLDTNHSQGGWAVAKACQLLHKKCHLYYPVRKAEQGDAIKVQQAKAEALGAELHVLQAGRSAVLYHSAKKMLAQEYDVNQYFMPNALKLPEMITETAAEVARTTLPPVRTILVSASSGTIAAGLLAGLIKIGWSGRLVVHQGYSRPQDSMRRYMDGMMNPVLPEHPTIPGTGGVHITRTLVDEGYSYADQAKPGAEPPFPCNEYYDLKLFRWWSKVGRAQYDDALMWNIG